MTKITNNIDRDIAIVTPLKNEIENIPLLVQKIASQSIPIKYWIIVENGSDDGSKEYLDKVSKISNVENFIVINFSLPQEKYELGQKYATVVNQGFTYLKNSGLLKDIDYLGILDADCFPNETYYELLVSFMEADPLIGISSGLGYSLEGKYDGKSKNWVRGNCRLWKRDCFLDAGYIIGPSADTLSVCKAELKGWKAIPNKNLIYNCRDVGGKVDYSYYGYSAYFRGITPMYALFKTLNYVIVAQPRNARGYFKGYFRSFFTNKDRISDPEIKTYFSSYMKRKLQGK